MSMQHFSVLAGGEAAGGNQAVMVPLNRKPLAPASPERVRRLRKHLVASLRDMPTIKDHKR